MGSIDCPPPYVRIENLAPNQDGRDSPFDVPNNDYVEDRNALPPPQAPTVPPQQPPQTTLIIPKRKEEEEAVERKPNGLEKFRVNTRKRVILAIKIPAQARQGNSVNQTVHKIRSRLSPNKSFGNYFR